jgi:hypothetical protein
VKQGEQEDDKPVAGEPSAELAHASEGARTRSLRAAPLAAGSDVDEPRRAPSRGARARAAAGGERLIHPVARLVLPRVATTHRAGEHARAARGRRGSLASGNLGIARPKFEDARVSVI